MLLFRLFVVTVLGCLKSSESLIICILHGLDHLLQLVHIPGGVDALAWVHVAAQQLVLVCDLIQQLSVEIDLLQQIRHRLIFLG